MQYNTVIGADSYATAVLPVATVVCRVTPCADLPLIEAKLEVLIGDRTTPPWLL